jgi:peroxiredoxin
VGRSQAAIGVLSAAFLGLVLLLYLRAESPARAVRPAPDFRLAGADGATVALSDLRGKTVLVNFWATWCPPCAAETPALEALHRRLGGRGLVVLGISVDESWEAVRPFVARYGVTYTVLLDAGAETARRYGTWKYPETYLVTGGGQIVRKYVGEVDWTRPEVVAEIEGYLGVGG